MVNGRIEIFMVLLSISRKSLKSKVDWILICAREILGELGFDCRKCQRCISYFRSSGGRVICRIEFMMISEKYGASKCDQM